MDEQIVRFNSDLNKRTDIEDFHLHMQDLLNYNIILNWLFTADELVNLIDTVVCNLFYNYASLSELGRQYQIQNAEWQNWYDNYGRFNNRAIEELPSRTNASGESIKYQNFGLPEAEKIYPIFEIEYTEIHASIKHLTKEKQLFVLFYFLSKMVKVVHKEINKASIYVEFYETQITVFQKRIESFIWKNEINPEAYLEAFELSSRFNVLKLRGSKISQNNFALSLYTLLWFHDFRLHSTPRGETNPYDTLEQLANYIINKGVFMNIGEISDILHNFQSRPDDTGMTARYIVEYYTVDKICKKPIALGSIKKYWKSRFFNLEALALLSSISNKKKLNKALKYYPELLDKVQALDIKARDFLLEGQ